MRANAIERALRVHGVPQNVFIYTSGYGSQRPFGADQKENRSAVVEVEY